MRNFGLPKCYCLPCIEPPRLVMLSLAEPASRTSWRYSLGLHLSQQFPSGTAHAPTVLLRRIEKYTIVIMLGFCFCIQKMFKAVDCVQSSWVTSSSWRWLENHSQARHITKTLHYCRKGTPAHFSKSNCKQIIKIQFFINIYSFYDLTYIHFITYQFRQSPLFNCISVIIFWIGDLLDIGCTTKIKERWTADDNDSKAKAARQTAIESTGTGWRSGRIG